jgi:hypothetical protein
MKTASLCIIFRKSDRKANIRRIWAYNTSTAMFEISTTIAHGHTHCTLFNIAIRLRGRLAVSLSLERRD